MRVRFVHEGVCRDFDVGVKLRRYDSYLDHSVQVMGGHGKLALKCPFKSLVQRSQEFVELMKVCVCVCVLVLAPSFDRHQPCGQLKTPTCSSCA
jgi:hypothetical protein